MKKLMRKVSHKDKDKDKEKDKKEKSEKHKDKKKHKHDKEASTSGAGKYTALSETTVTTKTSSSSIPGDRETKTVTTTTHTSSGPSGGKSTTVIEKKETGADGVTTITKESHDKSHKAPEKEDKKVKAPEKEKTGASGVTTVTKESHDKSHKAPEKKEKVKVPEKEEKKAKAPEKDEKKAKAPEKEDKKVLPTEKITSTKITTSFSSPAASEPKHASHMTVTTSKAVGGDEGKKVETVTKSVSHNDGTTVKTTETKSSYGSAVEEHSSPVRSVNGKVFLPGWNDKNEKYEVKEQMAVPSIAVARQSANLPKWMKEVKEDKKPKGKAVILEPDDPSLTFEVKRKETPVTVQGSTVVETVESVHTESSPDIDFSRLQEEAPRHTTTKHTITKQVNINSEGRNVITKIDDPGHVMKEAEQHRGADQPRWTVEVRKTPSDQTATIDHSIEDRPVKTNSKDKPDGPQVHEEVHPVKKNDKEGFVKFEGLEKEQVSESEIQVHVEPDDTVDFEFAIGGSQKQTRSYKGIPVVTENVNRSDAQRNQDLRSLPEDDTKDDNPDTTHATIIMRELPKHQRTTPKTAGTISVQEPQAVPMRKEERSTANLPSWLVEVKGEASGRIKGTIDNSIQDPMVGIQVTKKEKVQKGVPVKETHVKRLSTDRSPKLDFGRLPEDGEASDKKDNGLYTKYTQITTSKTVGNGEGTVTTTTKETSDDKGKKTKTETKTSGKIKEPDREVAISHTRQTDPLPSWLVEVKEPAKRNVAIDHSIKDPTFEFEVKRKETKPKPKGSEVVEEIHPIVEGIRDPFIFLDELEGGPARKQESRRQVQTHVEPEELFDFKVTTSKPKERAYKGSPVKEGFVRSVTTESSPDIDFTRLESQTPDRGEPSRYSKITTKNDVTSGKGNQGVDTNYNVLKQPQKTEDEEPEWDEFAEEIIIVNKKRKVRIPKNFVAYEKPRRHADPVVWKSLESLVEPPKQPKTKPVRRGYGMVSERVNESKSDKKVELPDLNRLAQ